MTINKKSTANMERRHAAPDDLDYYPTPPWASRALFEHYFRSRGIDTGKMTCWEPAVGQGHMLEVLRGHFGLVLASDIRRYPGMEDADMHVFDFLACDQLGPPFSPHWIITNPPFQKVSEFSNTALDIARQGTAMLARLSFVETRFRYENLFRDRPPTRILVFSERVGFVRGRVDSRASGATAHAWFVWDRNEMDAGYVTAVTWIPPGTKERLGAPASDPDLLSVMNPQ